MGGISKSQFLYGLDDRHNVMFAHIFDMAIKADKYGMGIYGDFLSENSISCLFERKAYLPQEPVLFGGFEGAERQMVAFVPEYEEPCFPISALKLTSPMLKSLTHRDYLGSVLGLGIKREKCGDIIMGENSSYIILSDDICSYAATNLTKVGRVGVKAEEVSLSEIVLPERSFKSLSGTVSSLRLDAVSSLFYGKGRSKAAEIISGGLVFVNGILSSKSDMKLKDGDVISIRGKGKATLSVGGTSKKDRIFITLDIWS